MRKMQQAEVGRSTMTESINVYIGTGKDKIVGIEEEEDNVIVNYSSNNQVRPIIVPRNIIRWMENLINTLEVGEPYKSLFLYNRYIKDFKIKSKIISDRMDIIKSELFKRRVPELLVNGIMKDLEDNNFFSLMSWEEMIGQRDTKTSDYFKVYGAIRYFTEKGMISYNSRGTILRII